MEHEGERHEYNIGNGEDGDRRQSSGLGVCSKDVCTMELPHGKPHFIQRHIPMKSVKISLNDSMG